MTGAAMRISPIASAKRSVTAIPSARRQVLSMRVQCRSMSISFHETVRARFGGNGLASCMKRLVCPQRPHPQPFH